MAAKHEISFEEGMERLEALVSRLEKGELPLDQSFAAYEQGVALVRDLRDLLKAGEARVMELTGDGEAPFLEGQAQ